MTVPICKCGQTFRNSKELLNHMWHNPDRAQHNIATLRRVVTNLADERTNFEAMLNRRGVMYGTRADEDDTGNACCVIVIDNHSENVNTFSHCFCEFYFDTEGSFLKMSYGY